MFSTHFKEIYCIFAENTIFEISKTSAKMAEMFLLWKVIS